MNLLENESLDNNFCGKENIGFSELYKVSFELHYSPASEASREVANLTERKNLHTLVYGVKNLSVCLSVTNFDPNYLRAG